MSLGTLYIISAPSGAGKTTLVRRLVDTVEQATISVSHTTRPPRTDEADGTDYHFVDAQTFLAMIEDGAFLEHARVFDHFYGTSRAAVESHLQHGQDVVLEIDWQGARQVRQRMPGCLSVFVLPPSLEVLESRLRSRGQDSDATIARRMHDAVHEMSHYAEYDYLIINRDFASALGELQTIFSANRLKLLPQQHCHRGLIDHLLRRS